MTLKIALVCGGPSPERGISLNSARSVMDHLSSSEIEIVPFYLDLYRRPYKISKSQLYSNTPSDFDFKLSQTATPLSQTAFVRELKKTNIVFPVIHGAYGEDGGIQRFLDKHNIPYVGSDALACTRMFDKFRLHDVLGNLGFTNMPTLLLKIFHNDHKKLLEKFFKNPWGFAGGPHPPSFTKEGVGGAISLATSRPLLPSSPLRGRGRLERAIVKPASGGSSIGVFSVSTPEEALEKVKLIFSKRLDTRIVVEPFATGREFTVIILQNRFGLPAALLPTEIETDYTNHQIFDYRKKYLPTRQVTYHCPPRFSNEIMQTIQVQAEQIFTAVGMRDFARFDGWVLPNGTIWFSDLNPISGMEQNSFLFQQAARVGLTHGEVLQHILLHACGRYGIKFANTPLPLSEGGTGRRKPVAVLFGGATSERQVSVMSGTNVWLKLRHSDTYEPTPYLLTSKNEVWKVPYPLALYHTAEEIAENCKKATTDEERLDILTREVRLRLGLSEQIINPAFFTPKKIPLQTFIKKHPFIFLALHGGAGENGELQKTLTKACVTFNGSEEKTSALCMDKWATKQAIAAFATPGVHTLPGMVEKISSLQAMNETRLQEYWRNLRRKLSAHTIIAKPRADGCSSGVVHLHSAKELRDYIKLLHSHAVCVPADTFKNQTNAIELPAQKIYEILLEKAIETDKLRVVGNHLKYNRVSGWIEITVGVVEDNPDFATAQNRGSSIPANRNREKLHAFNPSVTIAERSVLSVEEKFQGGTGINITPPPAPFVTKRAVERTKKIIQNIASHLGLKGYARIDAFMHVKTGEVMIIEVNTLPALTPSTVLYQQALSEATPVYPSELLEQLIKNKGY